MGSISIRVFTQAIVGNLYVYFTFAFFLTSHINLIEKNQFSFLRRIKCKFHSMSSYEITSLEKWGEVKDQMFLFKTVQNLIKSSYLRSTVSFKCPWISARTSNYYVVK